MGIFTTIVAQGLTGMSGNAYFFRLYFGWRVLPNHCFNYQRPIIDDELCIVNSWSLIVESIS